MTRSEAERYEMECVIRALGQPGLLHQQDEVIQRLIRHTARREVNGKAKDFTSGVEA